MHVVDSSIQDFLDTTLDSTVYRVFSLAGDASTRRYFRVVLDQSSWVLMKWEPYDPNNYPFISVLNHFKKNKIHVPQVVKQAPSQGLVLLEDLGDLTLERRFWESQSQDSSFEFYKMAIDEVLKIHGAATDDKSDCSAFRIQFDTEKLLWELNYGKDNLISGILKHSLSDKAAREINRIFVDICEKLHREPKRIAHRDYHSRNLMIKLDEMRVIDFQDARLGPIQYDLVSLLKDSYVNLNTAMSEALLAYYLDGAKAFLPENFSRHQFDYIYELQSIQRCFKACGSFASFYHQREDRRYLKYLSETLKRVLTSLSLFPEYQAFTDLIVDSGALEKKFELL
jgi:aminoglycoside/choline kinase family phosphotransferase